MLPEDRVVSTGKENPEAQLILSEHPVARTSIPKHPNLTRFLSYIWDNIFLRNLSNIYQITRCHKPEDHIVNSHGRKNKKSHIIVLLKFLEPKKLFQDICSCLTTVCESLTAYVYVLRLFVNPLQPMHHFSVFPQHCRSSTNTLNLVVTLGTIRYNIMCVLVFEIQGY